MGAAKLSGDDPWLAIEADDGEEGGTAMYVWVKFHQWTWAQDVPQTPGYMTGKKQSYAWRSLLRLPKAGCEQKAKGSIEAGQRAIFKIPIVIPVVTLPEPEDRQFLLFFTELQADSLQVKDDPEPDET